MSRRKGKVYVHGELWNAESDEPIAAGEWSS
jgi:membrane-bound ClpP family serine protease